MFLNTVKMKNWWAEISSSTSEEDDVLISTKFGFEYLHCHESDSIR